MHSMAPLTLFNSFSNHKALLIFFQREQNVNVQSRNHIASESNYLMSKCHHYYTSQINHIIYIVFTNLFENNWIIYS